MGLVVHEEEELATEVEEEAQEVQEGAEEALEVAEEVLEVAGMLLKTASNQQLAFHVLLDKQGRIQTVYKTT